MIVNNFLLIAASAASFVIGASLAAMVRSRNREKELHGILNDMAVYLENESSRVEGANKLLTDLAILTAQTKDAIEENARILRIVRNIVDVTTRLPKSRSYRIRTADK